MKRSGWIARRTPLKRGKLPKRGTPLKRGKRPRRVSAKRLVQLADYPATRLLVLARDGGCVLRFDDPNRCAALAVDWHGPRDLQIEHAYGRRGARLNDPNGCVAIHPWCHLYVTDHAKTMKPIVRAYLASLATETDASASPSVPTPATETPTPRFTL